MAIGNFGTQITFSVSSNKILTFSGYSETIGSRWTDHNIQQRFPRSEFLGSDLMTIKMTVVIDAALGVKPWTVRNAIKDCVRNGTAEFLVIGGKKISGNKYIIESAQNTFDTILSDGKIKKITMNLTFKEYLE